MQMIKSKKTVSEKQRLKCIQIYFNVFKEGRNIILNEKKYVVVLQKQVKDRYFLIVQGTNTNPFIVQLVYKDSLRSVRIYPNSNYYKDNKNLFDNWIKEAKEKNQKSIQTFFEEKNTKNAIVVVRNEPDKDYDSIFCKFISKKKLYGKYYFVVREKQKKYLIVKIVWYGFAKAVKLSEQEFIEKQDQFDKWLEEIKKKK